LVKWYSNDKDSTRHQLLKKHNIRKIYVLNEQDSQCTYNVTLGRVRVTIVAVETHEVLHIM